MSGYSYAKQRSAAKAHPEWMRACSSRCGGGTAPSVPFPDGLQTDGILYHRTNSLADRKKNEEKRGTPGLTVRGKRYEKKREYCHYEELKEGKEKKGKWD